MSGCCARTGVFDLIVRESQINPLWICYRTDSMTVLYFLYRTISKIVTFDGKRLWSVLSYSHIRLWNFVGAVDNPVDYTSRVSSVHNTKFDFRLKVDLFLWSTSESTCVFEFTSVSMECKPKSVDKSSVTSARGPQHLMVRRYSAVYKLWREFVWLNRFKIYLFVVDGMQFDVSMGNGSINLEGSMGLHWISFHSCNLKHFLM